MGTFTKSFGAAGGYIAGSKETIDRLKIRSHAMCYAEAMSPPVLAQVIASMGSIMGISPPLATAAHAPPPLGPHHSASETDLTLAIQGPATVHGPAPASLLPSWVQLPPSLLNGTDGRERLRRLAFNSRYLSTGLRKLGFIVYGHKDSPIIPVLLFNPGKMALFSRMMLERIGPEKTPLVVVVVAYPYVTLVSSETRRLT